ncbi:RNA polymerase sigma-70 factor [Mucilaginibacter kameinonensis]|uniref:RNA polymerase sigma-70 factor n=1 Tax=Mucilaginibacter kameinonensis TaxID=452286 RepID=UPI000EF7EF67|nr:RNA polymerase sigma-70 factor [Mucilaginibacter kameinonensis]
MKSYRSYSDLELLDLVKEEDRNAFVEIFERYNKLLYSHVYNKLRDEDTSRDLVQDVFVALWEKRDMIKNVNLSGYLFTMSRNKILNLVSHHKIVTDYATTIQNFAEVSEGLADERIREKQLAEIINKEINALPERMREVFLMSRFEHLSNREIAEKLNLSEQTVATHIKKSLRVLRQKIGMAIFLTSFCHCGGLDTPLAPEKNEHKKNILLFFPSGIPDRSDSTVM